MLPADELFEALRPSDPHSAPAPDMPSANDFSTLALDELMVEEKRMRSRRFASGFISGLLAGIAVWSATHEGGVLTFVLLAAAVLVARSSAQRLKRLRAEISRRGGVPAVTPQSSEVA